MSNVVENTTKKYELRKVNAGDIMPMARIIRKFGISNFKKIIDNDEMKNAFMEYFKGDKTIEEAKKFDNNKKLLDLTLAGIDIGFEVLDIVFERLPECETEVFGFLSSLSGLKINQIKALPMEELLEMIVEVVTAQEFKDFFKVASRLFK